jgi:hypothetical protein
MLPAQSTLRRDVAGGLDCRNDGLFAVSATVDEAQFLSAL